MEKILIIAKVKEDLKLEETDSKMGNLEDPFGDRNFLYFYCMVIIIMVVIYSQLPCKTLPLEESGISILDLTVLFFLTTACESTIISK